MRVLVTNRYTNSRSPSALQPVAAHSGEHARAARRYTELHADARRCAQMHVGAHRCAKMREGPFGILSRLGRESEPGYPASGGLSPPSPRRE